jgi:hypothetical protein
MNGTGRKDASMRTDTNVNLSTDDLRSNLVDGGETGGALTVDGRDGGGNWNAGMEGSHASPTRTAARWENVSDADVLNERRVEVDLCVNGAKNARKQLLWAGILKSASLSL